MSRERKRGVKNDPTGFCSGYCKCSGVRGEEQMLDVEHGLNTSRWVGKQAAEEKDLEFKDQGWTELKSLDSSAGRW